MNKFESMQINLLQISIRLKPGQSIKISREIMVKAVEGNLTSLIYDSVRESDIAEFIKQVSQNWGIEITPDIRGDYTMHKPISYKE